MGIGAAPVIRRLASAGARPSDDAEDRLKRAVLVLFPVLVSTIAIVWVVTYWAVGLRFSALIPLVYQVVSVVGLIVLVRTKRTRGMQLSQLWLMLLLPPVLQWSLGGFVSGSAMVIWSFLAPLGALLFLGRAEAVPWFVGFLGVVASSGLIEVLAPRNVDVPSGISVSFLALNVVGVALATFLMLRYFVGERDRLYRDLRAERETSERLLLNVLPGPIAERLKREEGVIADAHPEVTVLFADLVDFTPLSERISPEQTVALLDRVFSAFDDLADRCGLEKIKTIGDAYMVAAGIPDPSPRHAEAAADMALEMLTAVRDCAAESRVDLSVRIGIESGPVVAGVIGRRRFIYDLWGDTVNTASRMESHGVPGAVQVGPGAHELLAGRYRFEPRGPIEVKGKGPMLTHVLRGRREARREAGEG